jgi:predicted RNase H-like HicB family nuclease
MMNGMRNEFTAIIEPGDDGWFWARSPEVPGANGQGRTPEEAREDLAAAIDLVLEYLRDEAARQSSLRAWALTPIGTQFRQ